MFGSPTCTALAGQQVRCQHLYMLQRDCKGSGRYSTDLQLHIPPHYPPNCQGVGGACRTGYGMCFTARKTGTAVTKQISGRYKIWFHQDRNVSAKACCKAGVHFICCKRKMGPSSWDAVSFGEEYRGLQLLGAGGVWTEIPFDETLQVVQDFQVRNEK